MLAPTALAASMLAPLFSVAAQVLLQAAGGGQGDALGVVHGLHVDALEALEDGEAGTLGGPGQAAADAGLGLVAAKCEIVTPWFLLLPGLAGLAADDFAGVLDALALVGLRLAELADVGGHLAHQLPVDSDHGEVRVLLDADGDARRGRCSGWGGCSRDPDGGWRLPSPPCSRRRRCPVPSSSPWSRRGRRC